jgi:hypothetical protein
MIILAGFWATVWVVIKWILTILGLLCIPLYFSWRNEKREQMRMDAWMDNSWAGRAVNFFTDRSLSSYQEREDDSFVGPLLIIGSLLGIVAFIFWVIIPFWEISSWILIGLALILFFAVKWFRWVSIILIILIAIFM